MNKTKKIDVIIPTYHPDEKLERCLRMLKRVFNIKTGRNCPHNKTRV